MSGAPTGSLGGMYKSQTSAYSNISNIKLFHSDIQEGSAEQVRLALVFAGKDFEDVRLDRHEWTAEPAVNKYSYGATPVMQVDSTQGRMILTRSHAMLRYVARSFDNSCTLYPEHKPIECAAVDEVPIVAQIQHYDFINTVWHPNNTVSKYQYYLSAHTLHTSYEPITRSTLTVPRGFRDFRRAQLRISGGDGSLGVR